MIDTNEQIVISLRSDIFGSEDICYDSLDDLLDGIRRLYQKCNAEYLNDGIRREIVIPIGNEEQNNTEVR